MRTTTFLSIAATTLALAAMTVVACGDDRSSGSNDGCSADSDCKGDRICVDAECVDPGSDGNGGSASVLFGSGGDPSGSGDGGRTSGDGGSPPGSPSSSSGTPGAGTDITPPVVTSFRFDRASYGAGETGYIIYAATDDVSGVSDSENNCWSVSSASNASDFSICDTVEDLGGGSYRMPFTVGEFVENGDFYLSYASVHDEAGNYEPLYADYGDATFQDTSITVPHLTVTGGASDITPPQVSSFSFSSSSYPRSSTGYLEYTATDDLSGVADSENNCWSVESESGASQISVCDSVEDLGGGHYRMPFEIDAFVETGTYFLSYASVHDEAGNYDALYADYGDATYDGTSIEVPTVTITD